MVASFAEPLTFGTTKAAGRALLALALSLPGPSGFQRTTGQLSS